jgi:hypothetical protein
VNTAIFAINSDDGQLPLFQVKQRLAFHYHLLISSSEKPPPTMHMDGVHPLLTISFDEDKFPRLMLPEDLEDVTVKMIKNTLTEYMKAAWGMCSIFGMHRLLTSWLEHARPHGFSTSIPWRFLKAAASTLFVDPDRLAAFTNLDPAQLSGDEAFRMVILVSDAQVKDEASPLRFAITVETLNALDRGDEIHDSIDVPLSPVKTTDSCDKAKATAAPAAADDHSLSSSNLTSKGVEPANGDTVGEDGTSSAVSGVFMDVAEGTREATPVTAGDNSLSSSNPASEGVETADGDDACDKVNPEAALDAAGDPTTDVDIADGETTTDDRASSAISGVSMDVDEGTNDNSASITEQDGSDDNHNRWQLYL